MIHNVVMRRTRDTIKAQRLGDYGAMARGYGFLVIHCEHCYGNHAGMTCHY